MSLDFSPNGRLLLSASADNTVRLWNMRDGATKLLTEENPTILDHPCYTSAVFSPDGSYVAASHRDGVVRIWSVHTGRLTKRMEAHHSWANSVAFVPDGKGLVSGGGGGDGKLRYWDVSSLDSTRSRSRPQTTEQSRRRASVEECMQQEHEFIGHEVRLFRWIEFHFRGTHLSSFLLFCRVPSTLLQPHLMADGSLRAHMMIRVFVSGILAVRRHIAFSIMTT